VSATAPSARRVVVSWDAASDDVGVARYDVYRGGALLSSTQALSLDDTTVDPDTEYSYTVEAIDAAGHGSGQSPPAVVRTPVAPADQPPSSPTNLAASATGPYRVDLSWSPSTDDVGVARYDVYREGVRIDTVPSGTAYADTTVHPASTYSYTVEAIDTAGQPSGQSDAVSASTPADQHPSVPGDVRATAVSSTRVDVSWSASSDDVRVAGYDVYRDGARLASVADATTYSDASARPATTYSYTVEAIDSAGQGSGQSAGAPVTTPDHAPTAPTGVTATAVSSTRVDLTWSESTDDVGVRGYDVLRDGVVLATVGPVTSTSDTTVKAGTRYSYQIRAIDTADQRSALSAAAVVTTPSGAADPVVAAAGDIACASTTPTSTQCRQQATADLLADATAILPLGDNQYDSGTLAEYRGSYALSWGRFLARTFPAVGNHEYAVSSTAAGYFDYFGAAAGPRPQGYYSYNLGAWHVISLNSNCTKIGGCDSASAEYKWLQSDLAANPTRCTLAYWHHPLFGTGGGTTSVKPLWQLLSPAHADVVLNGHEHHYERFAPQTPTGAANASGIREFVVGTGGKSHSGFGTATPSATSQVRNSTTFGVLKLTLHPTSYDWRFVPESGKTFTDSGSSACV
jgi:acid phosphatase type 7